MGAGGRRRMSDGLDQTAEPTSGSDVRAVGTAGFWHWTVTVHCSETLPWLSRTLVGPTTIMLSHSGTPSSAQFCASRSSQRSRIMGLVITFQGYPAPVSLTLLRGRS